MENTDYPTSRADAKRLNSKYYFTGEPCKYGHVALRKTKGICVECMKEETRCAAVKRAAYFDAYNKREDVKDRKNNWYLANQDKVKSAAATRPRHVINSYGKAWKKRNLVWVRADTKARRRKHREATPPWITRAHKTEIRQIYQIAITMTQTTGEQYVVDHIWPLRSEIVCGLHVPWNLRVMTHKENLTKSNLLPPDEEALAFPPKTATN